MFFSNNHIPFLLTSIMIIISMEILLQKSKSFTDTILKNKNFVIAIIFNINNVSCESKPNF